MDLTPQEFLWAVQEYREKREREEESRLAEMRYLATASLNSNPYLKKPFEPRQLFLLPSEKQEKQKEKASTAAQIKKKFQMLEERLKHKSHG